MRGGNRDSKKDGVMPNQNIQGANMENFTLTIKVNNGDLFEGSLEQWEDCFFSFPFHFSVNDKIAQVQNYCEGHNYALTLSWKAKKEDSKVTLVVK